MDSSGNLCGTTYAGGGPNGRGTVFELGHGTGTITDLTVFNGPDNFGPEAGVIMDSSGNLYGTTFGLGASGDGTVFELAQGNGTITTLVTFNGTNGANPADAVIMDSNGNLYGTTSGGGTAGDGTVFEILAPLSLSPTSLPAAAAGTGYSQTLTASGGTAPYTFAVTAGALPAGLSLSPAGVLSGTPTAAGSFPFTVTATDSLGATGSQNYAFVVTPAAASTLSVTGYPSPTNAGLAGSVTVTALDPYGNVATGYTRTVHFTSSDPLAGLPADYTSTADDAGVHTFSATLNTPGTQALTATDTATGSITGSQTGITVDPAGLPPATFGVSGFPSSTTAGASGTITVTARDANGNVASSYRGTVHFTSSDVQAGLPADYAFTNTDQGVHTFNDPAQEGQADAHHHRHAEQRPERGGHHHRELTQGR
jgi:uncharacterized repeat protein (TIGR03803 family)